MEKMLNYKKICLNGYKNIYFINYIIIYYSILKLKAERFIFKLGFLLRFKPFENKSSNENQSNIETKTELFEVIKNNPAEDKLLKILIKIDKSIDKFIDKKEDDEFQAYKVLKWRYAALVLDTLFLYISIIYLVVTFISIVMSVPNLYKPN
jgi:hypothetical protein